MRDKPTPLITIAPLLTRMTAISTAGTSTVDNLERSGADAIARLICFQHVFLDGESGGGA